MSSRDGGCRLCGCGWALGPHMERRNADAIGDLAAAFLFVCLLWCGCGVDGCWLSNQINEWQWVAQARLEGKPKKVTKTSDKRNAFACRGWKGGKQCMADHSAPSTPPKPHHTPSPHHTNTQAHARTPAQLLLTHRQRANHNSQLLIAPSSHHAACHHQPADIRAAVSSSGSTQLGSRVKQQFMSGAQLRSRCVGVVVVSRRHTHSYRMLDTGRTQPASYLNALRLLLLRHNQQMQRQRSRRLQQQTSTPR